MGYMLVVDDRKKKKEPDDWWEGMGVAVRQAVHKSGVSSEDIVSIGADTTCCSVVALNGQVSPHLKTLVILWYALKKG